MKKRHLRKALLCTSGMALSCTFALAAILPSFQTVSGAENATGKDTELIADLSDLDLDSHIEDYYDTSVVQTLPDTVEDNQELSLLIKLDSETVLEAYEERSHSMSNLSVGDYSVTREGLAVSTAVTQDGKQVQSLLRKAGVSFTIGNSYDVLMSGFEIVITAKDYEKVVKAVGDSAQVLVSEEYAACETVSSEGGSVVKNDVNVYETGIFDSSESEYSGSGVTVAVLDTGLDYTHTAFDPSTFEGEEVITQANLAEKIGKLTASQTTSGLAVGDVYLNKKVPYAYDYADKDPDVYPINSDHGTHVSGIIVGNDDVITGVAPNAQLVSMKVFSDSQSGAKNSWIIAALEDCVILGVDVINMSLGSAAGFAREEDNAAMREVYEAIGEQGISLVTAAGNDYNSTFGSEKNGNLGLTSNPDSSVVGSPSTFASAISVASVSGTETPYLTTADGSIIYFTESTGMGAETKYFVNEILSSSENERTFTYVTIPGIGRSSDYSGIDVTGKIALVRRGDTTFEDKARIAKEKGAIGCIIYNNVSGEISMTVGSLGSFPVCSISQDDGEMLADAQTGTIKISRDQTAGPFMSNFSSWGPAADLGIKPEITAHGGEIYSAVPGQGYDHLSGTSMAAPNQAGVTALVRQYVKNLYPDATAKEITATVNQLIMSTADILLNKNGLAYSVRRQGAGVTNLMKATSTPAYLRSYDEDGNLMDKTKLELGDDPSKTGEYSMTFEIVNMQSSDLTYDVSAIVMTEGVSETLTHQGETTVTQDGYLLDGAKVTVVDISGGSARGNSVTVAGNGTAKVTVQIVLSDADKEYLDASFENGMYVEGFIQLTPTSGTDSSLSVPYLAFYGDWSQAPIFDLDYFETNKDELDDSIDLLDKTLPDAYATRPLGGTYNDYIVYLGSYAFTQDPSSRQISADRKYISLSNQEGETGTVNSLYSVYAGLLRSAKRMVITITDSVTGEVIYEKTEWNQRKSYSSGSTIYPSSVDIDFNLADYNLKNNAQYMVTLTAYLDYENDGATTNVKNTFSFPFVVDYEAPALTDAQFYTEYDTETKKTRLFVNLSVYDNHYSQGLVVGYIYENEPGSEYAYSLSSFGRYVTPVYSEFNTTSVVTYELTDYIDEIKNSYNGNSFIVQTYDYAQNSATYEVQIPDSVKTILFAEEAEGGISISPNETYTLNPTVFPEGNWSQSLNYVSSDETVVRIVNGKLIGLKAGTATITATANTDETVSATLTVKVLAEGEPGYQKYDAPVADSFALTGYKVNKVFYFGSSKDRDLGATEAGTVVSFTNNGYSLKMFPSESVTLQYELAAYFPENTTVEFTSSNSNIVEVTPDGTVTAKNVNSEGKGQNTEVSATVSVRVLMNGGSTLYSQSVLITVKKPYTTNSIYLMSYMGLGGVVEIPTDLGVTEIYQYAFSNYHYVPKDENDEISEEDPYKTKITYIGDDTITEVIIPEGVETINFYAFANLTALESVTLPSTLRKIQVGAFYGCTALKSIKFSGENNLQFIGDKAFYGCGALTDIEMDSVIAIGASAFEGTALSNLSFTENTQSIGARAFYGNTDLVSVSIPADVVKLGEQAFAACTALESVDLNASVIPAGLFYGCEKLKTFRFGKDVTHIAQNAFAETGVTSFSVDPANPVYSAEENGTYLVEGETLVAVVPTVTDFRTNGSIRITSVGESAFSGNSVLESVTLPNVTSVGSYAFYGCTSLTELKLGDLARIGDYAFAGTAISELPAFDASLNTIGNYAFFGTALKEVTVPDGVQVGKYAFYACSALTSVTVGDNAVLGAYAFAGMLRGMSYGEFQTNYYYYLNIYYNALNRVTVGDNVVIGEYAFAGTTGTNAASSLQSVTLGKGVTIGDYAFFNAMYLSSIDLSEVLSIGAYAFSGSRIPVYYGSTPNDLSSMSFAGYLGGQSAPLTSADLTSCESLGNYAFAFNASLASVDLGTLTSIGEGIFCYCSSLKTAELNRLTEVGAGAFMNTALTSANLANAETIGAQAFANAKLTSLTLSSKGAQIGDFAFSGNTSLAAIKNLDKAKYIGAEAFVGAAITEADLSEALYIGDFAFMSSALTSVELGEQLISIGENPFADCQIGAFEKVIDGEMTDTYSLSETVRVIDGVLYRVYATRVLSYSNEQYGLELVTYPLGKTEKTYVVADGTVRIGALAFYGTDIVFVELPVELDAIGDKAFYGCLSLSTVVFKSLEAPILEEEFDTEYLETVGENGVYNIYNRAPMTGEIELNNGTVLHGLEIVPYKMWNWTDFTNFYYGANFVDLIGEATHDDVILIMVRPNNGTGYENFIYGQYFDVVVSGMSAPQETTLAAIYAIEQIPVNITLNDEAVILAARAAYNLITTAEQQALVTNYEKLEEAESVLSYLKDQGSVDPGPDNPTPSEEEDMTGVYIAIGTLGVIVIALVVAMLVLRGKKAKAVSAEETEAHGSETDETVASGTEQAEETNKAETPAEASDKEEPKDEV